ncbi:unnamed protein product [Linum tenue]|uniref:Uncharacterized protein n=1 Tax=Linum tenue TaxID=586396 RepID=A0AAV0S911_9ROSI|nr:unnamed protein product [Linum tenue]
MLLESPGAAPGSPFLTAPPSKLTGEKPYTHRRLLLYQECQRIWDLLLGATNPSQLQIRFR